MCASAPAQIEAHGSEAHVQLNIKEKFNEIFSTGHGDLPSWCLILVGVRDGFAYQTEASVSQSPPQAAQQSPEQLQQLVAPIALYPDALVAQILAAATYPSELVDAEKWTQQHKDLKGDKLAKEVNKQSWDASVKALAQFPAVLANMNQNLAWTSELGDAYVNQQQNVTQAIQTMRQRAQQAGNLKTTSQEIISNNGETIVIQPAVPEVVYVPQYDPWLVYGAPLAIFPGWYPYSGLFLDGPGIAFGLGLGLGYLPASAGVGTVGNSIGTAAGESSITTTRTSRIAGLSSTAIVFIRVERTSIMPRTFTPVASLVIREGVPVLSAGSTMPGLLEATPSEDSPALAAPM